MESKVPSISFDQSADSSDVQDAQRNVAAILSLAQPVDNIDNPIFVSRYGVNYAV